ncbi:cupredoxin domain-containing protein [Haladaptatus sp. NG-WS-4]
MSQKKSQYRREVLKLSGLATLSAVGVAGVTHGDETTTQDDGHGHETEHGHGGTTTSSHGGTETEHGHGGTTTSSHGGTETEHGHGGTTEGGTESEHGHDDGHGDSGHGSGIGKATDHVTVSMNTNGGILDVLTGKMSLSQYLTENRNHFHPHVVHVEKGGTVTWKNESGRHAVVAYHPTHGKPNRIPDGAKPWDSGALTGGEFSHTFEVEGVYDYYCPPHEQMGMIGSVVVGNPAPSNQPGLKRPQRSFPSRVRAKLTELNQLTKAALDSGGEH